MEILRRGTRPEDYVYTGVCSNCNSKMRANHSELKHESCQREGNWHEGHCPVCQHRVYFNRVSNDPSDPRGCP